MQPEQGDVASVSGATERMQVEEFGLELSGRWSRDSRSEPQRPACLSVTGCALGPESADFVTREMFGCGSAFWAPLKGLGGERFSRGSFGTLWAWE